MSNSWDDESERPFWRRTLDQLAGLDTRSLALFRIVLGLILLFDLFLRFDHLTEDYSDNGYLPRAELRAYFDNLQDFEVPLLNKTVPFWSFHFLSGSPDVQQILFAVQALAGLCFLLGWQTRIATIVSWLLLVSLHIRNPFILNGGDTLVRMFLFWGMFLPLGERWSLDRIMQVESKPQRKLILSGASFALIVQLCLMYFFTGIAKWNPIWWNGEALTNVLGMNIVARPFGQRFLGQENLLQGLTIFTLVIEVFGPFLLLIPFRTWIFRTFLAFSFIAFHIGIHFTMDVGLFSLISICGWLALLPSEFWNSTFVEKTIGSVIGTASLFSDPLEDSEIDRLLATPYHIRVIQKIASVLCLVLIVYCTLWNVWRLKPDDANYQVFMPKPIRFVGIGTMIAQEFHMFGAPEPKNIWFVYEAKYRGGTDFVDVFSGLPLDKAYKPDDVFDRFLGHRTRRLHMNVLEPEGLFLREKLVRFHCERWNRTYKDEHQVEICKLIKCWVGTKNAPEPHDLQKEVLSEVRLNEAESDGSVFEKVFQEAETTGKILP